MNFSLSDQRIEDAIRLTNSIFPLIILPLATFGNSLCFLVFCRPKFQKRVTRTSSICLRLLCVNDSILLYLFMIDVLLKVYMKPSIRIYSTPATCRLYKFIRYSFSDMSAYLQLGLTTDRFICCVHHMYYSHWRKKYYLYYLLLTASLLILLKNSSFLSPLYGYPATHKNRTITKCSVVIKAKYFAKYMAYGQSLIDIIFITCIPFFLIVYFNSRILREVLRLRTECWSTLTRLIHLTPGQNADTIRNKTVVLTHHAKHRRLHLTFALGCISFVFVLSTAPYKIFKIVERRDKLIRDQQKNGAVKSMHIQLAEVIIDCLEYLSCSTPFFVCLTTSIGSNGQLSSIRTESLCIKNVTNEILIFSCPVGVTLETFDINDLEDLNVISLQVIGIGGRGSLKKIPENICRLKRLKYLHLSFNQIRNAVFEFSPSCLSELEDLDLSDNFLSDVPIKWISQMPNLKRINLAKNNLNCIPYTMFYNISNIETFEVYSNNIATFELWLIQIKYLINYSNNPVTRFTNDYNVDLSNYQSNITVEIYFDDDPQIIDFDDSIFEMYNRCGEINSTYTKSLMQAIGRINKLRPRTLNWRCSCEQYYLQEYIVSLEPDINFFTWRCPLYPDVIYREMCPHQSSFNFTNIKPRLCKINNDSETGDIPIYMESNSCNSTSDLESKLSKIYDNLIKINLTDETMAYKFANIIDEFDNELKSNISLTISKSIQSKVQMIISRIEYLLESIDTPINISVNSVAILSLKNSSFNSYSQIDRNDSSLSYSTEIDYKNSNATITIDPKSFEKLSPTDIYIFYYLPSSLFQLAQEDENIIIVSPIIGIHLPKNNFSRLIDMSFIDIERQSGRYSCVFWQSNGWNNTGCSYSIDSNSTRHFCYCNHTTSFALIFIPHKTIYETYIPSITIAILSIICFCISIVLSIYRQATCFRHVSITNIFTLLNSIILFILLTVILIQGYKSDFKMQDQCSISQENLVITTYFFLISTFASKTFLGICYFLTIFFHFIFIQFTSTSNKWFYAGFFLVFLIAFIPTIIINIIRQQWSHLFLQYQGICWLNSSVIFRFISIPIIIFIGLNLLIISGITIRLVKFSIGRKKVKTNEKQMVISVMIWLALCVSLGIAWIFGPFLDILVTEKDESSSVVQLWFFAIFIGLEGLWVLIVNVVFYFNQKVNKKNRRTFLNKQTF